MQSSRISRYKHQKKRTSLKWLWGLILVVVMISGGLGIKAYVNYRHWSAPYYNQTGEHVLYSRNITKLNDDQINKFYDIARGAIKAEDSKMDFTNISDRGLYVKKLNSKHKYHIEYICSSDIYSKFKFKTSFDVELDNNSLRQNVNFKYYNYESDLTNLEKALD